MKARALEALELDDRREVNALVAYLDMRNVCVRSASVRNTARVDAKNVCGSCSFMWGEGLID